MPRLLGLNLVCEPPFISFTNATAHLADRLLLVCNSNLPPKHSQYVWAMCLVLVESQSKETC